MKILLPLIPFMFLLPACDPPHPDAKTIRPLPPMTYSFDCLKNTAGGNSMVDALSKAEDAARDRMLDEVSDEQQSKMGDDLLGAMKKDSQYRFDPEDPVNVKLKMVLRDLLSVRILPSSIAYEIILLDDRETVNAFTYGGKIFITKAIIDRCQSQDQLYTIIGHEIGHNEKGHVRKTMQDQLAAKEVFGEYGEGLLAVKRAMTASFNQKQELEADYYGLDLSYMLGYRPCAITAFWKSMAAEEGKYSQLEDFFRTHPYSSFREACLESHILKNFAERCE